MTTANWTTFQGFFTAACDALESGDRLGALRNCLKAKMIALALAGQVSASGTSVNLVIAECDSLHAQIVGYFAEVAKLTSNGRLIKTSLRNGGRRWTGGVDSGGVLHD
jgi:hypothetical protein